MTAGRRPTKRLLIVPALVLAGVLATIILVGTAARPPVDETLEVTDLALPDTSSPPVCHRGSDGGPLVAGEPPVSGAPVTSGGVIACPAAFDGQRVSYTGEVIGDLFHREGGAWALVNDDDYALRVGPLPSHREHRGTNSGLSVWLPDDLAGDLTGLGRPGQRGDIIRIEGRIVRTDPTDGGGLTLRAEDIELLQPARSAPEPLHGPQLALAVVSLLGAIAATGLRRSRRG